MSDFEKIERLDQIDLPDDQKMQVLEWYAIKIWVATEMATERPNLGECKSYDPLTIEPDKKLAHSYVFDFESGGRHHEYRDLNHVEEMLDAENLKRIKNIREKGWAN